MHGMVTVWGLADPYHAAVACAGIPCMCESYQDDKSHFIFPLEIHGCEDAFVIVKGHHGARETAVV